MSTLPVEQGFILLEYLRLSVQQYIHLPLTPVRVSD